MKESGGALSAPSGVWSSLGIRKGFLEQCDFCGKREVVTRHQPGYREAVRRAHSRPGQQGSGLGSKAL